MAQELGKNITGMNITLRPTWGPFHKGDRDIVQYEAKKLLHELGKEFELKEEASETHLTPAGKEQRFAYFRLLRK